MDFFYPLIYFPYPIWTFIFHFSIWYFIFPFSIWTSFSIFFQFFSIKFFVQVIFFSLSFYIPFYPIAVWFWISSKKKFLTREKSQETALRNLWMSLTKMRLPYDKSSFNQGDPFIKILNSAGCSESKATSRGDGLQQTMKWKKARKTRCLILFFSFFFKLVCITIFFVNNIEISCLCKVNISWEGYKNLPPSSSRILRYYVMSKPWGRCRHNFMAFSENLNFNGEQMLCLFSNSFGAAANKSWK